MLLIYGLRSVSCIVCITDVRVIIVQFRTRNRDKLDDDGVGEWMRPLTAKDMNVDIMNLIAREMNPARRDSRYMAPYCPLRMKNARQGDDSHLLMDGLMPPDRKRATRAAEKARNKCGIVEQV